MWHADWFVHCDKCGDMQWMDGKNLQAAKATARKAGWSISATRALCPSCRPTPRAADLGKRHRFRNDVCEFCGGEVAKVKNTSCPNR